MSTASKATLSRKERKRQQAKFHAEQCGTISEAIASYGVEATYSNDAQCGLSVTKHVAFPLRLPADVFERFLVPYFHVEDLLHTMDAFPSVSRFVHQLDDSVFESMRRFALERDHYYYGHWGRSNLEGLKRGYAASVSHHTWMERYEERVAERREKIEALAATPGAAHVRALMKERQKSWATTPVAVKSSSVEGVEPTTTATAVMKSVAFAKQFACEHRHVGFNQHTHHYVCQDCRLVMHAMGSIPQDVQRI